MYPEMPEDRRQALESAMAGASYWDIHEPWFDAP
jgi:hypothetical protein